MALWRVGRLFSGKTPDDEMRPANEFVDADGVGLILASGRVVAGRRPQHS